MLEQETDPLTRAHRELDLAMANARNALLEELAIKVETIPHAYKARLGRLGLDVQVSDPHVDLLTQVAAEQAADIRRMKQA